MRRFIITNPNLSVGRSGDIVTADELKMSDDKLDEWVEAGYGLEIDDTEVDLDGYVPGEFVKLEGGTLDVASTDPELLERVRAEAPDDVAVTTTLVAVGLVDEDYEDVWDDDED
jgi:hypothetical protein